MLLITCVFTNVIFHTLISQKTTCPSATP